MRIAALVAGILLIAGCSHTINRGFAPTPNTTQVSGASPTTTVAPSGTSPSAALAAGAQISAVTPSIQAAHPPNPPPTATTRRAPAPPPSGEPTSPSPPRLGPWPA